MPELKFLVDGAAALDHAFVPALALKLRAINSTPEPVHAILVRCQVRIDAPRRSYSAAEARGLAALFAEPARWATTLRPFLWQHASAQFGAFTGTAVAEILLPCSLDFSLAATQYCDALGQGDLPLQLLFAGTVFYAADFGVAAQPIAHDLEARYSLPLSLWHDAMDRHYPDRARLRVAA